MRESFTPMNLGFLSIHIITHETHNRDSCSNRIGQKQYKYTFWNIITLHTKNQVPQLYTISGFKYYGKTPTY